MNEYTSEDYEVETAPIVIWYWNYFMGWVEEGWLGMDVYQVTTA
jgi:hypothetical protein